MSHAAADDPGPDLAQGVPLASLPTAGTLGGHVGEDQVLLTRLGDEVHAVSGRCTHYGGPLAQGLVVGEEVRCPWHHACFSLRTGAALKAPAFAGLDVWRTEVVGETVYVREKLAASAAPAPRVAKPAPGVPERILLLGGGAAGFAAADRLRTLGYDGAITMLSDDSAGPYDRPNLSKDYLAGTAEEDWIPLQGPEYYAERAIDLRLGTRVVALDASRQTARTATGEQLAYDAVLLATGAEPRRLPVPGFERANVRLLRSLDDARALIEACKSARSVVIIGAGFIGLEAAGALRERGLDVHVVAREKVPMQGVMGEGIGALLTRIHTGHGVSFHLGTEPVGFDGKVLGLRDGSAIPADLVLVGAGVSPRTELAAGAGLTVQDGIVVDRFLQASRPHHYAAGDVARFPYRGEAIRVEHWVHAQRQGQAAAANMLGTAEAFEDPPFFWTQHHELNLRYCGHGAGWDRVQIDGRLDACDFTARYYRAGVLLAAASAGRDLENLAIEAELRG